MQGKIQKEMEWLENQKKKDNAEIQAHKLKMIDEIKMLDKTKMFPSKDTEVNKKSFFYKLKVLFGNGKNR